MIVYYLGIPGSGKTYSAVDIIYNNFTDNKDAKKDLTKDYLSAFTNINDFKFDKCKNVYLFDYDKFYRQISKLHSMYKAKKSDDELIEVAKEYNLYKTLIVIDECHNYFGMKDSVLVWWLTYHRHLYHDIILITQNLALVDSKYKPLAEAFYKAKSSSLTLNKKYFNYMYYTESRMTKASYVNTKKVLKRKGVFDLYKSGDSVASKNVVLRFIKISIFLLIILFLAGYAFYKYLSPQKDNSKSIHAPVVKKKIINDSNGSKIVIEDNFNASDSVFMQFVCNNDMCTYKNYYFDIKVLTFAKENFNLHIINSRMYFSSVLISAAVDSSFVNFLKGGFNDESITEDSIVPFPIGK